MISFVLINKVSESEISLWLTSSECALHYIHAYHQVIKSLLNIGSACVYHNYLFSSYVLKMSENFAMQEKNSKVSSSTDGLNKGDRFCSTTGKSWISK